MYSDCVLVIEDDPSLGPLVQIVLEAKGFRVLRATTAVDALRIWEETGHAIPVALVDLTLEREMKGEALARQFISENPSLKVIITSGRLLWPETEYRGFPNASYLQKPFTIAELVRVVQSAFQSPRKPT